MSKRAPYLKINGIQLIEEAMYILRVRSAKGLLLYYTGSLPFVLGLLYFLSDMSRSAYAYQYCAVASFVLAFLFIWMKCWHTVFTLHIQTLLGNSTPTKWSFRSVCRLVAAQTIIQPTGILVSLIVWTPVIRLILFPAIWVFPFYQNTAAYDFDKPLSIKTAIKKFARQTKLWQIQNFVLIMILFELFLYCLRKTYYRYH